MRKFISKNPFTGKILNEYSFLSDAELDAKIERAGQAYRQMIGKSQKQKVDDLERLASVMEKDAKKYAEIITAEMGKPIVSARGEITRAISHCRYYAKHLPEYLAPTQLKTEAKRKTLIKYEPLGVIYYIIPFNFPFWLSFKGLTSTLLLGNSVIIRPADSTPMVGEAIQQIFDKAGLDNGEMQTLYSSPQQLDRIMANPLVGGVGFTGSTKAGSAIAACAGKHIKKSVMELGGSDPFIVLQDADIEQAAKDAVRGRCANSGQVCFSPKRFIIVGRVYELFKEKLIENLKKMVIGDPMDQKTNMGPLARDDLITGLESQLKKIPSSWKVAYKGDCKRPFFPITVYEADAKKPFNQELFGPIFPIFHAKDEKHAIQIANQGEYGLGSSIYSKNRDHAEDLMTHVRSGMVFINEVPKSQAVIPTGGVAKSGYGRECGMAGFREFANIRTYYVN